MALTDVEQLAGEADRRSLREYLERNVWPMIPCGELGRILTRDQEDQILGYGPKGY
jgi:antitoxin VapB